MNKTKMLVGLITVVTLVVVVGCHSTFEQRVGLYKGAISLGINTITNGTLTNVVGTIKSIEK